MSPIAIAALVFLVVGVVVVSVAAIRDRRRPGVVRPPRGADQLFSAGIAALLVALALYTTNLVAPGVTGVVTGSYSGKGSQYRVRVATAEGSRDVVGESGMRDRCAVGSHLEKPAWTTAYRCDGVWVGTGHAPVWLAIAGEFALALYAAWLALKPAQDRRRRRRGS